MNFRIATNGPLLTSIAAISLVVLTALLTLPPLLGALFGRGADDVDPAEGIALLVHEHEQLMNTYEKRFNGRSVFYKPPPPPRPEPKPVEVEEVEEDEPEPEPPQDPVGPPPPPAEYQGPPVSIVLGDQVLFQSSSRDEGLWIGVGEEEDGIEVVATSAPWSVTVRHQRGEYEVPVFSNDQSFLSAEAVASEPTPGLIAAPEEDDALPEPQFEQPAGDQPDRPTPGRAQAADDDEAARAAAEEQGIEPDVADPRSEQPESSEPYAADDPSHDNQPDEPPADDPKPDDDNPDDPAGSGDDPPRPARP